jgi:two-component system LytT family response regulator
MGETAIRALIVDDEPLARQRIRDLLQEEPDVSVVGECGDGEEALASIEASRPDLVFLDVQMPEMTGLEVLEALRVEPMPAVVFVTAYDEFALRAFDAHALDYLMKPFHRTRFRVALDRARALIAGRRARWEDGGIEERIRAVLAELQPRQRYLERLVVRQGTRIQFIRSASVDWIEADGNYARLHVGGRSYLLRETMSGLEGRLDPADFVRIHRSTIVNTNRIREIQPMAKGDYVLILEDGTKLNSSQGYRENLQALIHGAG